MSDLNPITVTVTRPSGATVTIDPAHEARWDTDGVLVVEVQRLPTEEELASLTPTRSKSAPTADEVRATLRTVVFTRGAWDWVDIQERS